MRTPTTTTLKYDNKLNYWQLIVASKNEQNLIFTILNYASITNESEIQMTFSQIRELSELPNMGPTEMEQVLMGILEMKVSREVGNRRDIENVFTGLSVEDDTVHIRINQEIMVLLINLKSHFTLLDLNTFMKIRSGYGKTLYRLLSQYKSTGVLRMTYVEMKHHFNINPSYTPRRFCNVTLNRVIDELQEYIPGLCYELTERNKFGDKDSAVFTFTFNPNQDAVYQLTENEMYTINELEVSIRESQEQLDRISVAYEGFEDEIEKDPSLKARIELLKQTIFNKTEMLNKLQ